MNAILRTTILAALAASLWLGTTTSAPGQPFLQRLEDRIRQRMEQDVPAPPAGQPATDVATPTPQPGYVGIMADDANDRGRGVRILDVRPGGPGDQAGLKKQDLITAVAGVRIREMNDLADVIELFPPGDKVVFDVLRGDKSQKVEVTMGQRPPSSRPPVAAEVPTPPPSDTVGPALTVPDGPAPPPDKASELQMLRQRVKELEQRIDELEKALAEALEN